MPSRAGDREGDRNFRDGRGTGNSRRCTDWEGKEMRAVIQRVERASVSVAGREIASIGTGVLVLVAVARGDTSDDLEWMARKIVDLRIFDDADGRLNRSLLDVNGELLLVSQFTLYGDCRKGRRPSYTEAAAPAQAQALYDEFVRLVRVRVPEAKSGQFQASMAVELTNIGPVTLIIDSPGSARM
jgi:D-tyrosyl-tRNA(Tyr) deacylase